MDDLFNLSQLKFYYKFVNGKLPKYFDNFPLYQNNEIHQYNTRSRQHFHRIGTTHEFAKASLRYLLTDTLNNTSNIVKEKVNTHSYKGFSSYVKKTFIQNYADNCVIENCYVCNQN